MTQHFKHNYWPSQRLRHKIRTHNSPNYVVNWSNVCQEEEAPHHHLKSTQPPTTELKNAKGRSAMDQKGSRRQQSSTRTATMYVGCVGMMYPNSTIVEIAERRRTATLTTTREQTRNQELSKRISSFRSGSDGVGSRSWNAKLQ